MFLTSFLSFQLKHINHTKYYSLFFQQMLYIFVYSRNNYQIKKYPLQISPIILFVAEINYKLYVGRDFIL
ncbi:hypothetical protein EE591_08300 [Listeria monocytogenes]|nr:hypothetical protein [Listeria monocytogenes]EAD3287373.1 hypothetical protein [Listeria monocytogenes]MCT76870.1 hypothetical protein [Listeria monocytogenes]